MQCPALTPQITMQALNKEPSWDFTALETPGYIRTDLFSLHSIMTVCGILRLLSLVGLFSSKRYESFWPGLKNTNYTLPSSELKDLLKVEKVPAPVENSREKLIYTRTILIHSSLQEFCYECREYVRFRSLNKVPLSNIQYMDPS